jgi:hypothetical protein
LRIMRPPPRTAGEDDGSEMEEIWLGHAGEGGMRAGV